MDLESLKRRPRSLSIYTTWLACILSPQARPSCSARDQAVARPTTKACLGTLGQPQIASHPI